MVDSKLVILQWLTLTGNPLLDVVAANDVVARRLPWGYRPTRACICFWRLSGAPDDVGGDEPIFSFRCYGADGTDLGVETVVNALVDRLHGVRNERLAGGQLISSDVTAEFDMEDLGYEVDVPMSCVFARMETADLQ